MSFQNFVCFEGERWSSFLCRGAFRGGECAATVSASRRRRSPVRAGCESGEVRTFVRWCELLMHER